MGRRFVQFGLLVLLIAGIFVGSIAPATAFTDGQKLLSEVWRIVDRAYVDNTFNHQNWWFVRQSALRQPLATSDETYAAIQKMLASLDDPFTRLLKPDQYRSLQTNTAGELTGVGLQIIQDKESSELRVIAPIEGSPADLAGIQPSDRITKIDGYPTALMTLDEAAQRMRGPVGSQVVLTISREGSEATEIEVSRDRITLNPVYAELRSSEPNLPVGYIRLSQFNANATAEVAHAIAHLEDQGATAYVLDLRNNPGGLLQAGIEIARLWLDEGVVVYTVNRHGIQDSFSANGRALTQAPLVVLVNQGTASASEILAGALQDNDRAKLVGERTFGKGLIQSLFSLSDGSGLAVTIAKYETPDHHDIHRQGIVPDVVVPLDGISREQLVAEGDRQYQAAVDYLQATITLAKAEE
ncbi:MAG: PDZ domain-containing protein [Leptolyngbyaceae cyanobacterium SL_7_1]|nr:PDZ domain-containing protein [Leptolyngbyaceae cyanobacterium SL_7_1]